MIALREITDDNIREILKLTVDEAQKNFVASNAVSLAQAWLHPMEAKPFAIYADDMPVGFFMGSVEMEGDKRAFGIWRFMIDKRYQGKGYGRAALRLTIEYLRGLGAKEIALSYEPENTVAAKLYESAGFVLTGEVDEGELIAKLAL